MTAITLTFDDAALQRKLNGLSRDLDNMAPVMDTIGQGLVDNIQQSLGRGKTPWGEAMKSLKYRRGIPLNDTRQHIYNRITHTFDRNSVAVGMNENVNIGATHQFGAVIKPVRAKRLRFVVGGKPVYAKQVTIPPRPFLPIRNNQADIPGAWVDDILESLRAALD